MHGINLGDRTASKETNKAKLKIWVQDAIQKLGAKFDVILFDKIFKVFEKSDGYGVIEKKHIFTVVKQVAMKIEPE